jgi:hypothetical protein
LGAARPGETGSDREFAPPRATLACGYAPAAKRFGGERRGPGRVCRVEVAEQRLLEVVAVFDVRAVPQLLNKVCQDGLRGQVPRVTEHLIRPPIQE